MSDDAPRHNHHADGHAGNDPPARQRRVVFHRVAGRDGRGWLGVHVGHSGTGEADGHVNRHNRDHAGRWALTEEQKTDALIADIAGLEGAVFIRNNTEHTAIEAAAHLRRKRSSAGGQITTAKQFIEQVASKSSLSGEPYRIRFSDGRVIAAGEYLTKRLDEIESARR